ncbi:alpha/beta hydrolase [Stagnimonas aquatica]|uniref:Alpha/beta hydrolase n=1 Tax=Stagnimonas aquatica TaxID=2689987 RepID=A0A3N0V7Y8_9GAMM|nr:alpha/beta hydrolase [Stagnimonas aquatica]ROH88722.1 alpha/beta hydrolase [Stagnimonas aquatica]
MSRDYRLMGRPGALPTIVLEAGGGASRAWWAWVQAALARQTLVYSYDRAGLGEYGSAPLAVDAEAVSARLAARLAAAALPGSYLLVGHSLGALYARHYAASHPEQVCGLVMVDATAMDPALTTPGLRWLPLLAGLLRLGQGLASLGLLRRFHPGAGLVAGLPELARAQALAGISRPLHLGSFLRELRAIPVIQQRLAERPLPPALPLLVVSAGRGKLKPGEPPQASASLRHHAEVAARSTRGQHRLIAEASHGSLLTTEAHAERLAAEILAFARDCVGARA